MIVMEVSVLKVDIKIDQTVEETSVTITAKSHDEEVKRLYQLLKQKDLKITASKSEQTIILSPKEITLIPVDRRFLKIHANKDIYISPKRLYEIKDSLGHKFIQISKSSIVYMDDVISVEVSFSGSLKVYLKNGLSDYISRFYVKSFKQYLGL